MHDGIAFTPKELSKSTTHTHSRNKVQVECTVWSGLVS